MNRRQFLLHSGAAAAGGILLKGFAAGSLGAPVRMVSIVAAADDAVATAAPARWAIAQLRAALAERKIESRICSTLGEAGSSDFCVLAVGKPSPVAREAGLEIPDSAEAVVIAPSRIVGRDVLFAAGSDVRGLVYALTELADALVMGNEPEFVLRPGAPTVEQPANRVRSVMRMVNSEVEDRPSYEDRDFWRRYLSQLATQRFNRFNLAFGLGYDFARGLSDTYFYFAYPFLLSVPGYDVRVTNLTPSERDRNLEMLRFISDETVLRGMQFQLGIWTHAFQWINSPKANHVVEGLTTQTQAAYSRDALALLLKECPNISGVTLRIHGESGVTEGSYEFWKEVFNGCVLSGRKVGIDMHAKGMDQGTIDAALATNLPIVISPKFWAEHMGLPYHQAAIRPQELPRRERGTGLMAISSGARSFLRYGYGDLLREDRPYGILHRIWPGTQRVLLWGDPVFAAGYGRAMSFCGSLGCEIMEPLSFKGREGSSTAFNGGRDGYADTSLRSAGGDFEKYNYTYRLWGRMLFNPDCKADVWERQLRREIGSAAADAGAALAAGSRVLPLVTTAFSPSASNNAYSPECGVNMSLLDSSRPGPYGETRSPSRFGNASPLDPQLFIRADEYATLLIRNQRTPKYSPIEVAQWLEDFANVASNHLAAAQKTQGKSASDRRLEIDVKAEIGLARFYAKKFRAAVLLALYEKCGDKVLHDEAVRAYRAAREGWAYTADATKDAYAKDLTFGGGRQQRGHWLDRLPDIDADIAAVEKLKALESISPGTPSPTMPVAALIALANGRPPTREGMLRHLPEPKFQRGQEIEIVATSIAGIQGGAEVTLHYRHAHQAEAWHDTSAQISGVTVRASIPGDYTNISYPITYYFSVVPPKGAASISPGLGASLSDAPYYVTRPSMA